MREAGFYILNVNDRIHLVGCYHIPIVSELNAHLKALQIALRYTLTENIKAQKGFH